MSVATPGVALGDSPLLRASWSLRPGFGRVDWERWRATSRQSQRTPSGPQTPPRSAARDRGVLRGILLVTAAVGLLGALSGFSVGTREVQIRRSEAPLFLVMDISRSMSVQDVQWGRLEAAKMLVRRVASRLPGTSLGLTVFAGETHQLLPPGPDRDLLFTYMESLGPDLVTSQGTALEAVLAECARMARGGGSWRSTLCSSSMSDGEDVSTPRP